MQCWRRKVLLNVKQFTVIGGRRQQRQQLQQQQQQHPINTQWYQENSNLLVESLCRRFLCHSSTYSNHKEGLHDLKPENLTTHGYACGKESNVDVNHIRSLLRCNPSNLVIFDETNETLSKRSPPVQSVIDLAKDFTADQSPMVVKKEQIISTFKEALAWEKKHEGSKLPENFFMTLLYLLKSLQGDQIGDAFQVYEFMLQRNFSPSERSFSLLIGICANANNLPLMEEVWDAMSQAGCSPHMRAYIPFVNAQLELGAMEAAFATLERMMIILKSRPSTDVGSFELVDTVASDIIVKICETAMASGGIEAEHVASELVEKILKLFCSLQKPIGHNLQEAILQKVHSLEGWDSCITEIQEKKCTCCWDELGSMELNSDEQSRLGRALDRYLQEQGETLDEIIAMKEHVSNIEKLDVCVDGLNVGRFETKSFTPSRLYSIAHDLEMMGMKYLIFIRQHVINRSDSRNRAFFQRLLDEGNLIVCRDYSLDDILFISAAIHHHPNVFVISNDHFRDHNTNIKEFEGGELFQRWCDGHVVKYSILKHSKRNAFFKRPQTLSRDVADGGASPSKKFEFFWPPKHNIIVQRNDLAYHFPTQDGQWICCVPPMSNLKS
eukprot:m.10354 g.10354  ORF g.10354 m.10354 type:complete len:610 (+) comp3658_c0_seq1:27-1856(+)